MGIEDTQADLYRDYEMVKNQMTMIEINKVDELFSQFSKDYENDEDHWQLIQSLDEIEEIVNEYDSDVSEFYVTCSPDGCEEFSELEDAEERKRMWIEEFELSKDDVWIETKYCGSDGEEIEIDDCRLMAGDSKGGK